MVQVQAKTPEAKRENSVFQTQKSDLSQSLNSRGDHAYLPQRTLGNEAIGRVSQANLQISQPPDQLPSPFFTPRLNHDFSRIPMQTLGTIQPKLTIGQPNDKYEQEADRIADLVMRASQEASLGWMEEPECPECEGDGEAIQTKPVADQITPFVQRQTEPEEEEEEEPVQAKLLDGAMLQQEEEEPEEEEEEEPVQTKAHYGQTPVVTPRLESRINSLQGSGQPLPASARAFFEPLFGYDFSGVRVHADAKAAETTSSVNAKAFTMGKDIVFSPGQYAPETSSGQRLIAHELTHVMQQIGTSHQIVQRKSARIPKLTTQKTAAFFKDLNATLLNTFRVTATLSISDFTIMKPAKFVAYARTSTALSEDYSKAEQEAKKVCASQSAMASNRKFCRNKQPTDLLIAEHLETRGVTEPTYALTPGATYIIEESALNKTLLNIVHEGIHRSRGTNWARRSKTGRYSRYHYRTKAMLPKIGTWLDEGTVQIITNRVISEMQKIPNKSWFKGFSTSVYAAYVKRVNALLSQHGKNVDFLIKAYFSNDPEGDKHVQDLQSWQ